MTEQENRRVYLLERKYLGTDALTDAEQRELAELQSLFEKRMEREHPMPFDYLEKLGRLK